jgi:hypothetical protein
MGVHINGDEIIEFHGQLPEAAKRLRASRMIAMV